jgi:hypothetical protein
MSLFFTDSSIFINGSGIVAESAGLSSTNGITPINIFGYNNNYNKGIDGPLQHNLSISYVVETSADPIYNILTYLQTGYNNFHFNSSRIISANISGEYYLKNYSISVSPNTVVKSSVNFVGFNNVSGSFAPQPKYSYQNTIANGSNILFFKNGISIPSVIYDFQYSFEVEWTPEYIIGQTTPIQVQLSNKNETIKIIKDTFLVPNFSGNNFLENFNDSFDTLMVYTPGLDGLQFSLTGFTIKSYDTSITLDNIILQTLTLVR